MTDQTIHCPKCSSENVVFSKKRGVNVCEDCAHEFAIEKFPAPLRLFLSYGHDDNEELVRRIKGDLEKRGHDVWFDKNEIKFGDEWRRSITDGILKSHRVLSFLSKHSTRDPGVCRDEIAIAIGVKGGNIQTILVESEQEVQPPVNIGHIQWLDMHDWKERRATGEAAWEQWYQAKLAEIVRVVESDESRRFAGEIETLNGQLKPIKSEARICQLLSKGFYGRQWLFEAVEKWRLAPQGGSCGTHRLFWIMGAPGVGKSAFAAQLTHTRGDIVIAAQFCEWDKPDHRNAPRVVRSLAFQLATRLPDYRKLLLTLPEIAELDGKGAAELFDYLLANPLRSVIHGGRERYLIVIDALDEAGEAGRNPLVEMLAHNAQRLPDWLGLVVTSRPEFDVKTPLQALNPFPLDTQSESNRADIRDYLRRELASSLQNRPDADRLVEQILEKSEGVFLYVERFCDDVQRGHLSLDRPEQFPQGLGGIFCQYFQRQFPDLEKFRKDVRPALRAILAARESLPVEILQRLFNWQDEELRDFTRTLGSLFPTVPRQFRRAVSPMFPADLRESLRANAPEVIKPFHKSLADWLSDETKSGSFYVSLGEGHRILAKLGLSEYQQGPETMNCYFLVWLPLHLKKIHDDQRSHSLEPPANAPDGAPGSSQRSYVLVIVSEAAKKAAVMKCVKDVLHDPFNLDCILSADVLGMEHTSLLLLQELVHNAEMIMADISEVKDGQSNPSFFYQLRYATMIGPWPLFLIEAGKAIPTYMLGECIEYEDRMDGIKRLKRILIEFLPYRLPSIRKSQEATKTSSDTPSPNSLKGE